MASFQPKEANLNIEINENLNFEQQILEAAKAISTATSALIRSAASAQREVIYAGKGSSNEMYYSGTWSDGFVGAAKQVASANNELCEEANKVVQGKGDLQRVIAASRNVSSTTAQLLTSSSVRTDANSQAQRRLKAAGKSVIQATEALCKAAAQSDAFDNSLINNTEETGGATFAMQRAKELDAQARVLQMEKELEMARGRLAGIRKTKYNK